MPEGYKISIQLPLEVYNYIMRIALKNDQSFSQVAASMLAEVYRDDMAAEGAQ